MYSKIAHFYGWTHKEIDSLGYSTLIEYWKSITIIEAQQMLNQFQVVSYPKLKDQKRKSLFSKVRRLAYGSIDKGVQGNKPFNEVIGNILGKLRNGR